MKLASRLERIEPFYVMEMVKAAQALAQSPACDPAQGGERLIALNIGEPDFTATQPVSLAAEACARGWARLDWSVLDWNEPARAFYRSLDAGELDEWTTHRLDGATLARLASLDRP